MTQPLQRTLTIDQAIELARDHQFAGRLADAAAVWRQIVAAVPSRVDLLNELAMVTGQLGNLDEAESLLQRVVDLSPGYLPAWHNLAVAAERRGNYELAVHYLRRSIDVAPVHAETRFRLAQALRRAGELDEALRELRVALDLDPKDPEARGMHANLLLLAGDFALCWDEYEVRWQCNSFPDQRRPWTSDLRVTPDTDLRGKRIAVYGEQGYGDMIQFSRYARLLADRGADVTVVVPTDLAPLLQSQFPGVKVSSTKSDLPADYLIPMMSLPRVFSTTLETIPSAVPYIAPSAAAVEKWRARVEAATAGGTRKIGIAWAGRPEHKQDRQRTVRLAEFAPLADVPGVTLFSLQKGSAAAEANPPPAGMRVVNLTAGLADFADTAAFIANMDLVIAVDTVIVHLAGAMGKPVWTLIQHLPDFRWLLNRDDSPWYPTMRLFRQPAPNDWGRVFQRVATELRRG